MTLPPRGVTTEQSCLIRKEQQRPRAFTRHPAEEPRLTRAAFSRLLEWLDDGVGSQGERYPEMRRRLVSYFDRRNRPSADDLASETLSRIGRTLENDGAIAATPPAQYCYVRARRRTHDRRAAAREGGRCLQELKRGQATVALPGCDRNHELPWPWRHIKRVQITIMHCQLATNVAFTWRRESGSLIRLTGAWANHIPPHCVLLRRSHSVSRGFQPRGKVNRRK